MKLTTTKELNNNVFNYILNSIDSTGYEIETTTDKEKLSFLANCFKEEYLFPDNLKRYGSYLNVFKEWLQGLPSSINIVYENYDIIQLAKEWKSIPENATPAQEEKIINNYFAFMAYKTFQLMKAHKVLPY